MSHSLDNHIRVHDAHIHNLKSIDIAIPRNAIVVLTGVSGSGKSSLAFDTIYAESQQRFWESVAPYARRLLQQFPSPQVRSISGLPPAVALRQQHSPPSSRSSVGTISTASNVLRMLFSRAGTYPVNAPRLDSDAFSARTAAGACPNCQGLGIEYEVTEHSLVPDPTLSIRNGAVAAWPGAWQGKNQRDILKVLGHDIDAPWQDLDQSLREWILFTDEQPVVVVDPVREVGRTQRPYKGQFMSAKRYVMKALTMSQSAQQRRRALAFVETSTCAHCHGSRLTSAAIKVKFLDRSIVELSALAVRDLAALLRPLAIADRIESDPSAALCTDLVERLDAIDRIGLGYLTLDRPTPTLSAGELQRLRIAAQLRSGLYGVVYVLDEPSAGLHPSDIVTVMELLTALRENGNSLLVVEHNLDITQRADWVIDIGPGAGTQGGRVVYSGHPSGMAHNRESITGMYLAKPKRALPFSTRRHARGFIELDDVHINNVQGVDLRVPVGCLNAITGVSGSGKSSLVDGALASAVAHHLGAKVNFFSDAEALDDTTGFNASSVSVSARWKAARGLDQISKIVRVDQRPIGRSRRSNIATYSGAFDTIRKLFAATSAARERSWKAGHFSFNVDGGRCKSCQGEGAIAVELMMLASTYSVCSECAGSRYQAETLTILWNGLSIADVLALTISDAVEIFKAEPSLYRTMKTLCDVGLGYLTLDQNATELSGGEAQRVKLAKELQRTRKGHVLYLLDEPTTGLHAADVDLLIDLLNRLVNTGHTALVAEHNMRLVACCDHVIDLGPKGGDEGGRILAQGTPEQIVACPESTTATYLLPHLSR